MQLYAHNQIAYEAAVTMLESHRRAAVIHPTGIGKSFLAFWLSGSSRIIRTPDGLVQAEHATFELLFLRSETICRFGLPIKEFFIWDDDVEFTGRIIVRSSVPCFIAGQNRGIHTMIENTGSGIFHSVRELAKMWRWICIKYH